MTYPQVYEFAVNYLPMRGGECLHIGERKPNRRLALEWQASAEVPILDAMTQGTSKAASYMVKDMVETLANRPGFSVMVFACGWQHRTWFG